MALTDDDFIKSRILTVRSVQVLLDRDLAMLYGVETKVLNQAVKRNIARFPDGFMFQLSHDEMENWKSQFVTSNLSDEGGDFPPQKVFFDGKHYDAYSFARKLVRKAKKDIVLVDNYCDDVTLDILSQKCGGADVMIATTHKSATKFISPTAVDKFNKQNPTLTIKTVGSFHDRFLILDGTELYHFGASMKDLGRQYCAITKMDAMFIPSIMQRIPQS